MLRPPRSLRSRALQLLAQRDQSKVELRRKLLAHARAGVRAQQAADRAALGDGEGGAGARAGSLAEGFDDFGARMDGTTEADAQVEPAVEVEAVLTWLEAQGFLSLERFAESRVHARVERFGNLRIRRELAMHEVALSSEAVLTLAASEFERAVAVRARKFAAMPTSASEAARQARFLCARGFTPDVIRRVLRKPRDSDSGDS